MKNKSGQKRAVVLLSGGLDSAVALFTAIQRGYKCSCLLFDYGQRHLRELEAAESIAKKSGSDYRILKISFPWKGTSLIDTKINLPLKPLKGKIPSTYVPGRNIIFLSFALSYAEAISAEAIFLGVHAQDYSGYPDCRPEFLKSFRQVIAQGTKAGVEGRGIRLEAPLLNKKKAEIIKLGLKLGVPLELTWSCYRGRNKPCGQCDSCHYRALGFQEARLKDPAL